MVASKPTLYKKGGCCLTILTDFYSVNIPIMDLLQTPNIVPLSTNLGRDD